MRSLYQAGALSQVQLLLNQQQADALSRHFHYYDYLLAARRDKMRGYLETVERLKTVEAGIAAAVTSLQASQAELENGYAVLVGKRDERKAVLASLDADLRNKGNTLRELEMDRAALQKVIDQIEQQRQLAIAQEQQRQAEAARQEQARLNQQQPEQPAEPPVPGAVPGVAPEPAPAPAARPASPYTAADLLKLQSQAFSQRKGSLRWPVNGVVANRFGEARQGSVKWDGIRIGAAAGSEVHAVHYGRVMYADWLRGQGLLIILDHGDGYMSLYAHNDVLLHEPGEWVQAGEPLARVGISGGEKDTGLYFEIRKDGEPVDPQLWLGKK